MLWPLLPLDLEPSCSSSSSAPASNRQLKVRHLPPSLLHSHDYLLLEKDIKTSLKLISELSDAHNHLLHDELETMKQLLDCHRFFTYSEFADALRTAFNRIYQTYYGSLSDHDSFISLVGLIVESLCILKAGRYHFRVQSKSNALPWCRFCDSIMNQDRMTCCDLCGDSFHFDCLQYLEPKVSITKDKHNQIHVYCSGCAALLANFRKHISTNETPRYGTNEFNITSFRWFSILFPSAGQQMPLSAPYTPTSPIKNAKIISQDPSINLHLNNARVFEKWWHHIESEFGGFQTVETGKTAQNNNNNNVITTTIHNDNNDNNNSNSNSLVIDSPEISKVTSPNPPALQDVESSISPNAPSSSASSPISSPNRQSQQSLNRYQILNDMKVQPRRMSGIGSETSSQ